MAVAAGDAFLVSLVREVRRRQGHAAGAAQRVLADFEAVFHAHALVEDEALALPEAFFFGHILEVFQDPALEVVDLVQPFGFDEGGRFFAADAAGAEHGDLRRLALGLEFGAAGAKPFGKFSEALGFRVDRAFERADLHLVIVAGVDHDGVGIGNQRVPVLRRDIGADALDRVEIGLAHGDDFRLHPHLAAIEGHGVGARFLHFQIRAARQCTDMVEHRLDARIASGDRAVDALMRQQ